MATPLNPSVSPAVICCGNRLFAGDALGPRVYDYLRAVHGLADLDVIDGGLAGLDLLHLMSGRGRVVLVDALEGEAFGTAVQVLRQAELAALAGAYGHGAGLPYLAAMAPEVLQPMPEILLVGCAAAQPPIPEIARKCIQVARHGQV